MKFECLRVDYDKEEELEKSKIFGSPVFPKDYMKRNKLNDDYYLAQINLEELNNDLLPKEGRLYFFLRFTKNDIKPIVLYSNEELYEVMDDVNEVFGEYDFKDALVMDFTKEESGLILEEIDNDIPEYEDSRYIVLFKIDPLGINASDFPIFNNPDDEIYFIIDRDDLKNRNFKKVELLFYGS